MHVKKMPGKIEVDLHGLMREDAAYRLSHLLTHAGRIFRKWWLFMGIPEVRLSEIWCERSLPTRG